jgi:hypothetical protein
MNQGEKRTTQRIPLTDANGGYNNKKIALREVMTQGPSPLRLQKPKHNTPNPRPPNMAPCPLGLQNLRGLKKVPKYEALHVPLRPQKSRGHLEELYI